MIWMEIKASELREESRKQIVNKTNVRKRQFVYLSSVSKRNLRLY
jgi:hypothetical protein